MNVRTLKTKGRCEPNGIPEALITTWLEQGWPDLVKGSGNSRFGGDETQIDPAFEQHDPKSCNFFYLFFDIFLLLRSNKEVTTENLSLNKWKTWPAEISEDCRKMWKKTSRDSGNSRFGGDETQIDPASEQHNPKSCNSFIFFDIFLLLGALKK